MKKRNSQFQQRRRVFVGCEGASERGYAALIQRLSDDDHLFPRLSLHIDAVNLNPGAGDPEQLVRRASAEAVKRERGLTRRDRYFHKAIFLDLDRVAANQDKLAATRSAAIAGGFQLVWQDPQHEALLLRHLPGCHNHRPPASACFDALRRMWPEYHKGMAGQQLATRIAWPCVQQACLVESELAFFLRTLGFPI